MVDGALRVMIGLFACLVSGFGAWILTYLYFQERKYNVVMAFLKQKLRYKAFIFLRTDLKDFNPWSPETIAFLKGKLSTDEFEAYLYIIHRKPLEAMA